MVAKPLAAPYQPNVRTMLKIKHERTADVVVAGYRLHKTSTPESSRCWARCCSGCTTSAAACSTSGSRAAFTAKRRAELVEELAAARRATRPSTPGASGRRSGIAASPGPGAGRAEPVERGQGPLVRRRSRPELVLEVGYDHMEGTRFRHTAQFKRWRPDRDPESCGYEQLEEPVSYDLGKVLSTRS